MLAHQPKWFTTCRKACADGFAKMQPVTFAAGHTAAGATVSQGSAQLAGNRFRFGDVFRPYQITQVFAHQIAHFRRDKAAFTIAFGVTIAAIR